MQPTINLTIRRVQATGACACIHNHGSLRRSIALTNAILHLSHTRPTDENKPGEVSIAMPEDSAKALLPELNRVFEKARKSFNARVRWESECARSVANNLQKALTA